jgi:tripartite-type tricarboxylate transporter receptor subunit TctC
MNKLIQTKTAAFVALSVSFLGIGFSRHVHSAVAAAEAERAYTSRDIAITDAQRRAAESFYRGKTLEWVTYAKPDGSSGVMLRLIQKYLPKYIPGNPRVGSTLVMVGGGGLLSANYLYNRASKDGTMLGQLSGATHRNPIFRRKGVEYDIDKFTWIADYLTQNYRIIITRKGIGLDTLEQLLSAPRVNMGTMEVGHNFYNEMRLGMYFLRVKFNIIPAYSAGEQDLAVERGEIDGRVEAAASFLASSPLRGKVVIHWQTEPTRYAKLPEVPTLLELAKKYANPPLGPKDMALMETNWDLGRYARYLAMPPGVPVERALAVQEAAGKMIDDKEFYAEFSKLTGFEPKFTPGPILHQAFRRLLEQPKGIIDLWLKLSGPEPLPKR